MPRLISLESKTSLAAFARSSASARMRIFSPENSTAAPVPRKS